MKNSLWLNKVLIPTALLVSCSNSRTGTLDPAPGPDTTFVSVPESHSESKIKIRPDSIVVDSIRPKTISGEKPIPEKPPLGNEKQGKTAIKHGSDEPAKLDSIKKAKQKGKG